MARQFSEDDTFDFERDSLLDIEIHPTASPFNYFYNAERRTLIKQFLLAESPRVRLYVTVTLITSGDRFTPRFRFWKRDTQAGKILSATETEAVAHIIKASVDTTDGHENLMKLMNYLISLEAIDSGPEVVRAASQTDASILESLQSRDRPEVLALVGQALESALSDRDIALITGRKLEVERFGRLLEDKAYFESERVRLGKAPEALWQDFFERATWIFGYGLSLISHNSIGDGGLETVTTGANLFSGAGKRVDALMRSRALVSTLLFCEIKRHDTDLLAANQYRKPDVWVADRELVGGVAQLQKTVRKVIRSLKDQIETLTLPDGSPTGLDFSTTHPRQVLIIGHLKQFVTDHGPNGEKMESFELFRRAHNDVEIVTFDELYERARFIVEG
ncbi:Shedu immune nuclease family protein [Curtobacterium sp. CT11-45]